MQRVWWLITLLWRPPMLTETGRVMAVEADSLWIETIRQSTCGTCSASKGCGHGLMNRIGDGRRSYMRVLLGQHSAAGFDVGQDVRIAIPEQVMLQGSAVVYGLPLLSMLLSALLASQLVPGFNADLVTVAGAALGLALGVLLVRMHARYHRSNPQFQPQLLGPVVTSNQQVVELSNS